MDCDRAFTLVGDRVQYLSTTTCVSEYWEVVYIVLYQY